MLAARLNKVIVIEKGTPGTNDAGTPTLTWCEYMTTYSNVFVPSQDTRFTSEGELFSFRTIFEVRYNSNTKEINNKYRIKFEGDYYKILQVAEIGVKEGFRITTVAFDEE